MICSNKTAPHRRILIDIDTQSHFFCRHSPVRIKNARSTLSNIQKVMEWARMNNIPTISTLQLNPSHFTHVNTPEIEHADLRKQACTICPNHLMLPAADSLDWSTSTWDHYDQVIIQKRSFDPFDEPRADRIFTEIAAEECILIGTPFEGAVKATAMGLLLRQKKVTMVTNAIGTLDLAAAEKMMDLMDAKGVRLVKAGVLTRSKRPVAAMSLH